MCRTSSRQSKYLRIQQASASAPGLPDTPLNVGLRKTIDWFEERERRG